MSVPPQRTFAASDLELLGSLRSQSDRAGRLVPALVRAWNAIRERHCEVPPVVLAIGPGSRRGAKRIELGHFARWRWSPRRDSYLVNDQRWLEAFEAAIANGDRVAASEALSNSADALWREAVQLSDDAKALTDEVFITLEGLADPAAGVLATLLHEAAHAIASARGIKDTSRQGRYHNARFRAVADELGLRVSRDPPFGWSTTVLVDETAMLYSDTLANLSRALDEYRKPHTPAADGNAPRGHRAVTLVCRCGERIRPTRHGTLHAAVCTICGQCSVRTTS